MERDTLFIGHANPEDNDFTLWMQAKLINEGFKAECDISYLTGGEEDYWKTLQDFLEVRSAKYLLVLSKNTFKKQGVIDEWEQVKIIAKKNNLSDFIYVLKIDDVPFDVRIGLPTKNHFRFDISWADGLKKVIVKLIKDDVKKERATPLSIDNWTKNRYSTQTGVLTRNESYFSNWLGIENLPEKIYFFRYHNSTQSETIEKYLKDFPVIRHDNYIISFSPTIPARYENHDFDIEYSKRIEIAVKKAFQKYETTEFPNYDDLRRFLVRLLKEAWFSFMEKRKLHAYQMSGNTKCYHYLLDELEKDKVFFKYNNKSTHKQLIGDFFETKWHYAISVSVLLQPILCFSLNSHLLFSDNGKEVWSNKKKILKARRAKGKSFFNKEWRDLMLGFIASLSDDQHEIKIPIADSEFLVFPLHTVMFKCRHGYEEPKSDGRLVPLDYYEEADLEDDGQDDDQDENGKMK